MIQWVDLEAIWHIAEGVTGLIALVTVFYLKSTFATKTALVAAISEALEPLKQDIQMMDQHGNRISSIEREISTLATREDVQRVLTAIAASDGDRRALAAKVDGMGEMIRGQQHGLDLIREHLMKEAAR